MKRIAFSRDHGEPIALFESVAASSVPLGHGRGEIHVYCIHFDPGGRISPHPAGFGQLFLVMEGSGWASGSDGVPAELRAGEGAFFERGELHAKGSDSGMIALMIQATDLAPVSTG